MRYIVITLCVIVVGFIGIALYYRFKKPDQFKTWLSNEMLNKSVIRPIDGISRWCGALIQRIPAITGVKKLVQKHNSVSNGGVFPVEELPMELFCDSERMMEITDKTMLAKIDALIPGLIQTGSAAQNAGQAAAAGKEVLYRAIIPAGAKLVDSRATEGAVRGFYRGAKNIKGHADLIPVHIQKGTAMAANTAAAAMSVASMAVGQYYMEQISTQLEKISDQISKIVGFQENEFKSRVFALAVDVKRMCAFQSERIVNNYHKAAELNRLADLETKCEELLGQANLTIREFTKQSNLDFNEYEEKLREAQNWYHYQVILTNILSEISNLTFVLYSGSKSKEECTASLSVYMKQTQEAQKELADWHHSMAERYQIDMTASRRKRSGLEGAIFFLPGLINDEWKYRGIAQSTADLIDAQTSDGVQEQNSDQNLYQEDVSLIFKDGKVYYLPQKTEDQKKTYQ